MNKTPQARLMSLERPRGAKGERSPARSYLFNMRTTAVVALATGAAWVLACRQQPVPPPPPIPSVTVIRPLVREVMEWDEYTGHLEAVESVEVRARVGGLITATPFPEGSMVKAGDVLVEIDARPFQAVLDSRIADQTRAAVQMEHEGPRSLRP